MAGGIGRLAMAGNDLDVERYRSWLDLEAWLGQDVKGRAILARFRADPRATAADLANWASAHSLQAPVRLANYVSAGGELEKLINIGSANVVVIQAGKAAKAATRLLSVFAVACLMIALTAGCSGVVLNLVPQGHPLHNSIAGVVLLATALVFITVGAAIAVLANLTPEDQVRLFQRLSEMLGSRIELSRDDGGSTHV